MAHFEQFHSPRIFKKCKFNDFNYLKLKCQGAVIVGVLTQQGVGGAVIRLLAGRVQYRFFRVSQQHRSKAGMVWSCHPYFCTAASRELPSELGGQSTAATRQPPSSEGSTEVRVAIPQTPKVTA